MSWHDRPVHPGDRHYRNQVVRLTDLTVTQDVIEGVTFENCTLVGPAVILLMGTGTLDGCKWDGSPEAMLWPLEQRREIIGAIALVDCSLIQCRMQRIGLAYTPEQWETLKAGFGL